MQTRRTFLTTTGATITLLPFAANADGHSGDVFTTPIGDITINPIAHASFVMQLRSETVYVDPVGDPAQFAGLPDADLIFITHEHFDHYDPDTLAALSGPSTNIITNPAVFDMLPDTLKSNSVPLANGASVALRSGTLTAIPAYNTTEGRTQFHPQGRDNGYVLDYFGFRIYVSGDTEDIPEMRALQNIDLAFVCMNLPFTMDASAAASAVAEFAPKYVYPYHYRGRDGGTQDPADFAALLPAGIETKLGGWYG